jgi:hypothetical protein
LKITLVSDAVAVPVEPVSKVLMTLADASETKSKPPASALRMALALLPAEPAPRSTDML